MSEKKAPIHELIPKHRILSKKEVEEFLKTYKVLPNQIPKISIKDPALIGLDPELGDIIEITRSDGSKNYRLVVKLEA